MIRRSLVRVQAAHPPSIMAALREIGEHRRVSALSDLDTASRICNPNHEAKAGWGHGSLCGGPVEDADWEVMT
jgi:hypothetical protein